MGNDDDAFFAIYLVGESGNLARFGVSLPSLLLDGVFTVRACANVERQYTPFSFLLFPSSGIDGHDRSFTEE